MALKMKNLIDISKKKNTGLFLAYLKNEKVF